MVFTWQMIATIPHCWGCWGSGYFLQSHRPSCPLIGVRTAIIQIVAQLEYPKFGWKLHFQVPVLAPTLGGRNHPPFRAQTIIIGALNPCDSPNLVKLRGLKNLCEVTSPKHYIFDISLTHTPMISHAVCMFLLFQIGFSSMPSMNPSYFGVSRVFHGCPSCLALLPNFPRYVDLTSRSLVTRVCGGDGSLMLANRQVPTTGEYREDIRRV